MKTRLATCWLKGCAGCHMSVLDLDLGVVELAGLVDIVYGPLVDFHEIPEDIDVALVEGAVGSEEDLERIRKLRARSKVLIALGDCAITGNVPAMRNPLGPDKVLQRAFVENAAFHPQIPGEDLPALLPRVRPLGEYVKVDFHLPGCPPPPEAIHFALTELLAGRVPELHGLTRFGR